MTQASTHPLNPEQESATDGFFQFLMNDDKYYILAGAAGVGKTYTMGAMIDIIMPRYVKMCELLGIPQVYNDVVMTATTNKAAEVLSLNLNRPATTIHSFLNLKVREDFKTGKQILSPTPNWEVHNRKIIFIDECSMIDFELAEYIDRGTEKCKVIFVGDHNQLPPVFEKISSIYNSKRPFYELTTPMRNGGSPDLMALCAQYRTTVETGEFKPLQVVPGVIDYLSPDEMQAKLQEVMMDPNHNSRILAYTNKQVNLYNQYIREIRGLPVAFTDGELLVNNQMYTFKRKTLSVEEQVKVIQTSLVHDDVAYTHIDPGLKFDIQVMTLENPFGERLYEVKVPINKDHFNDVLAYFSSRKMWKEFFELKQQYADLRPRDAATVHKSQGSTYDSVFIDLANISGVRDPNVAARMLYVAVSRARQHIYLYGDLSKKYGGMAF